MIGKQPVFAFCAALAALLALPSCSGENPVTEAKPTEAIYQTIPFEAFPEATSVRLFVDSGEYDEQGYSIVRNELGIALSDDQRRQLNNGLTLRRLVKKGTEVGSEAACFVPHHFFRFYDENQNEIGSVDICFCCEGAQVRGEEIADGDTVEADYDQVKALVEKMGEPTDIECGKD